MSDDTSPAAAFIVAWAFDVKPEHRAMFEEAYGPLGAWVRLFFRGAGYIRTELYRDLESRGRYITIDYWGSREQYAAFRKHYQAWYEQIDEKCEVLTESEQLLGEFDNEASLRSSLPYLERSSLVLPAITIRPPEAADVPAILDIERRSLSAAHWTETAYNSALQKDAAQRIILVAENLKRQLCGFVVARIVSEECELENIVVASHETRKGIGWELLRVLVQQARSLGVRRVFLEVRESNCAARQLYEKLGFVIDGQRHSYYNGPSESAILYSRGL